MKLRKVILSRKGFDSVNGGMPSPILPDGTMLSLPIPDKHENTSYNDLLYNGISYQKIMSDLGYRKNDMKCHLDPDLRYDVTTRVTDWKACYGQSGVAASHLRSQGIGVGDIFLFFGWFRQTERDNNGKLRYVKDAPDIHAIFGYLQVGEVASTVDEQAKYHWHPHSNEKLYINDLNFIYASADRLLESEFSGAGVFRFDDNLCLTKKGYSRSRWELPECLASVRMTYHNPSSKKKDYFQSAMIGQEFVLESNIDIEKWLISLFNT